MLSVIPEGCMDCDNVEAGVGSIRTHPSTSQRISDSGEGVKGEELSRKHWSTLNRLRTAWGRSVQSIDEEVGTDGQCGM